MPHKSCVSVYLRTYLPRRWHPAIWDSPISLRPLHGLTAGAAVFYPDGCYYLRYRELGQRKWKRVGFDVEGVLAAKMLLEKELQASMGKARYVRRVPLSQAVHIFCRDIEFSGREAWARKHHRYLTDFISASGKTFLDEVTQSSIKGYVAAQKTAGISPTLLLAKMTALKAFLKSRDIEWSYNRVLGIPLPTVKTLPL